MLRSAKGFTLIELMIVIAIKSIANLHGFVKGKRNLFYLRIL
ncbi:MAG: prepilin-type N-terminal cleavage/methylation domain-containing protein [Vulcanimicrobiota bacterium]